MAHRRMANSGMRAVMARLGFGASLIALSTAFGANAQQTETTGGATRRSRSLNVTEGGTLAYCTNGSSTHGIVTPLMRAVRSQSQAGGDRRTRVPR